MDTVQLVVVAAVLFAGNAISRTPANSRRLDKAMLMYWLRAYCLVFFGVYLAVRVISPEVLAGAGAPNDGMVWQLATVAWGSTLAGVLVGRWVRGLRSGRAPENQG
jgi:hypothetical protein